MRRSTSRSDYLEKPFERSSCSNATRPGAGMWLEAPISGRRLKRYGNTGSGQHISGGIKRMVDPIYYYFLYLNMRFSFVSIEYRKQSMATFQHFQMAIALLCISLPSVVWANSEGTVPHCDGHNTFTGQWGYRQLLRVEMYTEQHHTLASAPPRLLGRAAAVAVTVCRRMLSHRRTSKYTLRAGDDDPSKQFTAQFVFLALDFIKYTI